MTDRRSFLKTTTAAAAVSSISACTPDDRQREQPALPRASMDALASVVLPSALGADGHRAALERFLEWADAFEPVAELNHGYGTSEIRYGPADPRPGWAAQLDALDLEARRRFDTSFPELEGEDRTALVRDHLERAVDGPGMPSPDRAPHVAAALIAHWYRSSEATDLCYEVDIGRLACRGIETAPQQPAALERG